MNVDFKNADGTSVLFNGYFTTNTSPKDFLNKAKEVKVTIQPDNQDRINLQLLADQRRKRSYRKAR